METTILTSFTASELKALIRETILEVLGMSGNIPTSQNYPELMDAIQAAEYLKLKLPTLYDKTHKRTIPYIKKGNKLYFERTKLDEWLRSGERETVDEIKRQADAFIYKSDNHTKAKK